MSVVFYQREALPNAEEIIQDLHDLIVVYREVDALIGERSIEQFNDYLLINDDGKFVEEMKKDSYQEMIHQYLASGEDRRINDVVGNPVPRPDPVVRKGGEKRWPINAAIAAEAIRRSHYKCEYALAFRVFTSKHSGQPFMEAHHLVPMYLQGEIEVSLDRIENIVCISPHAHGLIHHAIDIERGNCVEKIV